MLGSSAFHYSCNHAGDGYYRVMEAARGKNPVYPGASLKPMLPLVGGGATGRGGGRGVQCACTAEEYASPAATPLRLPSKHPTERRLIILFTLAMAYPGSVSVGELTFLMDGLMTPTAVRRALYYLYHHYRAVERVSRGYYRARGEWLEALERGCPLWRDRFLRLCIEYNLCDKIIFILGEIDVFTKLPTDTNSYHRLPRIPSTKFIKQVYERNPRLLLKVAAKILESRARLVLDELGSTAVMAVELVAMLLYQTLRGRPYIVASSPRRLAYALQDLARALLGEGSSIASSLDPDSILSVLALLRDSQLVFVKRYGGDWKLRLDRSVVEEVLGRGGAAP